MTTPEEGTVACTLKTMPVSKLLCLPLTVQVSFGGMARTLSPVWTKPASIFPLTQNPDPWSENSEAA